MGKLSLLAALCATSTLSACASQVEKRSIVLEYADFGPQAMAYNTLGPKKLPWRSEQPLMIGQGKIWVVVYRDMSLESVRKHYPADTKNQVDYRYLPYDEALSYLDKRIAQNLIRNLTGRLKNTRRTIVQFFR